MPASAISRMCASRSTRASSEGGTGTSVRCQACGSPAMCATTSAARLGCGAASHKAPPTTRTISTLAAIASQPRRTSGVGARRVACSAGVLSGTTRAPLSAGADTRKARARRLSKRSSRSVYSGQSRQLSRWIRSSGFGSCGLARISRRYWAQSIILRGPNGCLRRTARAAVCGRGTSASIPRRSTA